MALLKNRAAGHGQRAPLELWGSRKDRVGLTGTAMKLGRRPSLMGQDMGCH
jgi:hypothetical protein